MNGSVRPGVQKAIESLSAEEESKACMTPKCDKEKQWKGLCRSCYGQARNLIEKGETTWEELESMGLCVSDAKPFTALFKQLKKLKRERDDAESQRKEDSEEDGPGEENPAGQTDGGSVRSD